MYKIYTKPDCSECEQAKMLLRMKGVKFTTLDVIEEEGAFDFIVAEGFRKMPAIYKNDVRIGGLKELKESFKTT